MGFTVYYRSTRPVAPVQAAAIERGASELTCGRTWHSCEPVCFFGGAEDGHLLGGSKPNFQPHPDDAAAAAEEGLPDGTTKDLLDILCELSRVHDFDWEISHDHSGGPIGFIRAGVCDSEVRAQIETFADVGDMLRDLTDEFAMGDDFPQSSPRSEQDGFEDDEDGPPILKFRPKG